MAQLERWLAMWVQGNFLWSTSSSGNIYRVTGPLCSEFTGHRWIPRTKASDTELWLICAWINGVNNREAGDLRCHCTHYDVTVMLSLSRVPFSAGPSQISLRFECPVATCPCTEFLCFNLQKHATKCVMISTIHQCWRYGFALTSTCVVIEWLSWCWSMVLSCSLWLGYWE